MNPKTSKLRSLLSSASLLAMASGAAQAQEVAQAQMAQATPEGVPEQVLVTGSLIRGTVAVGVPVTNLSPQDYAQTGALTTSDLFRTVPAANVTPGPVGTQSNANIGKETRVNIRGLDPNDGTRALLMIDGYRFPGQGEALCTIDPSIIPALALDRIDILVDGASATYGSDAISGVVNAILKRGYDGAVTQLRTSQADGKSEYQASVLWGRTWESGDITLTYEWDDDSPLKGNVHSNFSLDFSPWGLDNRTPVRSSIPGTISLGNPTQTPGTSLNPGTSTGGANAFGRACNNCYAIPAGSGSNYDAAPNPLVWSTFAVAANGGPGNDLNGTRNEINPYSIAWYDAAQQRNVAVATVDQRLTSFASFFAEGFYDNRRAQYFNPANLSPVSGSDLLVQIPTSNPYYPIGAPNNIRVNYNISLEAKPLTSVGEIADRYLGGINLNLPFDWEGKIYYGESFNDTGSAANATNPNAVSAALGWTMPAIPAVGTTPGIGTWTKPATVPYLDLFCDPRAFQCNSPATISYIMGVRNYLSEDWINQKGATFDGPLFPLPAGDVKLAVGGEYTSASFAFHVFDNTSSPTLLVPRLLDAANKQWYAVFTQLNVPLVSEVNALPLVRRLDLEGSWRHDQYHQQGGFNGGTSNPKVAFNWTLTEDYGVTIRGAWGTSFRAPGFAEESPLAKTAIAAWNSPLYAQNTTIALNCNPAADSLAGRLLNPGQGFVGWNGVGSNSGVSGQSCGPGALPIGMALLGAAGVANAAGMRLYTNTSGQHLHPESAMNWALTAEFAPSVFLRGLDIQATWYQIKINGALRGFGNPNTGSVNDPTLGFAYIVPTDIAKAGVDVAGCSNNNTPTTCPEFENMVAGLLANPRNPVPAGVLTSVLWINDGATYNAGYIKAQGVDFSASYDIDLGELGAWNTGIVGTYNLHQFSANFLSATDPEAGQVGDVFHTTIGTLNGIQQVGVETTPRVRARARLGWADGPFSVTGFVNYTSHFFNTQNAPPNVNFACTTSGGTIGGGTLPCAISNYTDIEPPYYTFDLSFGYNTGDVPANDYLKHVSIQLVIQNVLNKLPAFEYRIGTGGGNPANFDITESDQGRTFGVVLTKTW